MIALAQGLVAFLFVLLIGSFMEYSIHRLMHSGKVLGKKHADHHAEGVGQGWLGEFIDYTLPAIVIAPFGFFLSVPIGIGLCLGALAYGSSAAYAHQLQHEKPELCFWLPMPVHHTHHEYRMWDHNFGILCDVWDRVFGTYRREPFERVQRSVALREYFEIKWR
jgi:sterol desaturase/sphingolipid hydroxylase (fatty acid hydroxylase superfamily)